MYLRRRIASKRLFLAFLVGGGGLGVSPRDGVLSLLRVTRWGTRGRAVFRVNA